MFGFKSKKEVRKEILKEIREEHEQHEAEALRLKEEAIAAAKEKIEAEQKVKDDAEKEMRESADPWVDIKAIVHDPKKGVQIELDWNDAFIAYLKENGYTGVDEEAIIQKYLAVLTQNIVSEMDEAKESEYE